MAFTGVGIFTKPQEDMAVLLANSATFRTWTGSADVDAALEKIYLYETDYPETDPGRWAIVGDPPEITFERRNSGRGFGAFTYSRGSMFALLQTQAAKWTQATTVAYRDAVHNVLKDVLTLQGSADAFKPIDQIEFFQTDVNGERISTRWRTTAGLFGYQAHFVESVRFGD